MLMSYGLRLSDLIKETIYSLTYLLTYLLFCLISVFTTEKSQKRYNKAPCWHRIYVLCKLRYDTIQLYYVQTITFSISRTN